jgi:hypothetical protein
MGEREKSNAWGSRSPQGVRDHEAGAEATSWMCSYALFRCRSRQAAWLKEALLPNVTVRKSGGGRGERELRSSDENRTDASRLKKRAYRTKPHTAKPFVVRGAGDDDKPTTGARGAQHHEDTGLGNPKGGTRDPLASRSE